MLDLIRLLARAMGLAARRCPVCGAVIHSPEARFCPECARAIRPRTGGYCPSCGHMSGREDAPPSRCPECRHEPPPWSRLHFHGRYAGPLRDLILGYKFHGGFNHARLLADMAERAYNGGETVAPDVIVPVPLHPRRLAWRGFNQSTEMARVLSGRLDRPVFNNGLARNRDTVPQTRLDRRGAPGQHKGRLHRRSRTASGKDRAAGRRCVYHGRDPARMRPHPQARRGRRSGGAGFGQGPAGTVLTGAI